MAAKKLAMLAIVFMLALVGASAHAQGDEACADMPQDAPTELMDTSISEPVATPMAEIEIENEPAAAPTPEATPTCEPEIEAMPSQEPVEETIFYTVLYFDVDAQPLMALNVASGTVLEAGAYPYEIENFLGWYLCDASGACMDAAPYAFDLPVEGAIFLRARLNDAAEPANEAASGDAVPKEVRVSSHCDTDRLMLGSRITLTAALIGYEGQDCACHWQCAAADETGVVVGPWQDVPSAELTYSYVLTKENLLTAWRMRVTLYDERST